MITYIGTGAGVPPPAPLCRFPPLIVEYPEKNSNRCLLTTHFFMQFTFWSTKNHHQDWGYLQNNENIHVFVIWIINFSFVRFSLRFSLWFWRKLYQYIKKVYYNKLDFSFLWNFKEADIYTWIISIWMSLTICTILKILLKLILRVFRSYLFVQNHSVVLTCWLRKIKHRP